MPLFEFHCPPCRSQFELLVRNSEKPACPECGSVKIEKLLSAPARPSANGSSLPIASSCPPPSHGPCGTGCCRLPG
ncbi:FmdB family zinc ribbon protein [Caulifigura coniformis]|uniref:FmdB family zinc ribbon protein n=1 Tax=Caulifigura coniformis TaxID=2527983 RepID=UPI0011A24A80